MDRRWYSSLGSFRMKLQNLGGTFVSSRASSRREEEHEKKNSLGPFFLNAVEKGCGAFAIVFLRVDRLIKVLELLNVVLR